MQKTPLDNNVLQQSLQVAQEQAAAAKQQPITPVATQQPQQEVSTQQKILASPAQQLQQEHAQMQRQQLEKKYQDRKPITSNQDLIDELGYKKPLSDEEKAKQEKRERSAAVIAAIGDGISALSNLYFANKGAQSTYDPSQSLSAKMMARRDMLHKEREANDMAYKAAMLRAKQIDETLAERREARLARERYNDERLYQQAQAEAAKQQREKEKLDEAKRVNDAKIEGKGTFAKTSKAGGRRSGGRGSSNNVTVRETYDNHGRIKNTVVTTKGNKTPPSRRTNTTPPSRSANNIPPSKRK